MLDEGNGEMIYTWNVADEASRVIGELERVLRSRKMRDVAEYGYGHRLLIESRFESLGDRVDMTTETVSLGTTGF